MEYVKGSYKAATSPVAKRTYLGAVLFFSASLALLSIAALAYPVFYYNYVPKKVISLPIHLQYDTGLNPYGITSVNSKLMLEQAYDISVELTLPRSPVNLERGNFMVTLFGMKTQPGNPAFAYYFSGEDPFSHVKEDTVVFTSRRPALIPYTDPLVKTASHILFLPYYILYPSASETTTLRIPMGELVEFNDILPMSLLVEVQAGQAIQVYSATITLVARLTGIRWAMYNHRIISFVVCTTIFWIAEMLSTGLAWLILSSFISSQKPKTPRDKLNAGPGGDTWMGPPPVTMGLFHDGAGDSHSEEEDAVKKEEDDDDDDMNIKEETPERERLAEQPADDEEDGEDVWREKGAGTGSNYEKGGSIRRRSSRGGRS
ncbi:putative adipose-regulatory protein-domain-containing protein [Daldinia sp. FL1419]|nr:putative adipose-regulatory protein-domain-containing protein [Daldinia sp. FL1419]